jgi:hypothetical protein
MRSFIGCAGLLTVVIGCANDPVYIPAPMNLEGGVDDGTGVLSEARAQLALPINTETAEDATKRAARTAALGVDVPYVKVGDIEVEVEWTIKNLEAMDGDALVELNGANELFVYDPTLIVLSDEEEAPPTPGLEGDIPIHIPANGSIGGLFREDQLREASIDLDQITRGNVNPFRAMLTVSKNADAFQPMSVYDPNMPDVPQTPVGDPIPREAFRQLIRVDLVFKPTRHMVLEYTVRVRDVRGIMNELLLSAPPGELQAFAPQPFAVAPTP